MIRDQVEGFYEKHLAGRSFVAAHVRGSDKYIEQPDLKEINSQYFRHIDTAIANSTHRIFLLTDSQPVADAFLQRYGDRLVLTDSLRSRDNTGVHYKPGIASKSQLGFDVMKDTYLAARADRFIGNGASNVSCMVRYLKKWGTGEYTLLASNMYYRRNTFIYG